LFCLVSTAPYGPKAALRGEFMQELIRNSVDELNHGNLKQYFEHITNYIQDALEKKDL
jgi:hypothetical protein